MTGRDRPGHAVSADVLVADGAGYRMRHELLREAVYSAIPAGERRRLHRRIAESLAEAKHPDTVALARHWYDADEPAQAALANLEAATLTERLHAPGEAFTYLERALEHFDAPIVDCGICGRPACVRTPKSASRGCIVGRSPWSKNLDVAANRLLAVGGNGSVSTLGPPWSRCRQALKSGRCCPTRAVPIRARVLRLCGYLMMANAGEAHGGRSGA